MLLLVRLCGDLFFVYGKWWWLMFPDCRKHNNLWVFRVKTFSDLCDFSEKKSFILKLMLMSFDQID